MGTYSPMAPSARCIRPRTTPRRSLHSRKLSVQAVAHAQQQEAAPRRQARGRRPQAEQEKGEACIRPHARSEADHAAH